MQDKSVISQILKTDIPKFLFHYTSSVGLIGIVESKRIWTTKIHYMNDSTELHLAFKYIREEIEFQKSNNNRAQSIQALDEMLGALDSIDTINTSVASFTEEGDQLSQWRGYCKIGDGYSLGFDGEKLDENTNKLKDTKYRLVPCVYEEHMHKLMAKELVNSASVLVTSRNPNPDNLLLQEMGFKSAVLFIAPMIKANGFKEEKEWRLISTPLEYNQGKFRNGSFSLIPYWEFDLDLKNMLGSITIGPTSEQKLSELALSGFLMKNYIDPLSINIKHSKVPFRQV